MKIQMIKERSIQAVGPQGPFTRVFAIGDVVDLPEISARYFIADGGAILVREKAAKVQDAPEAPVVEDAAEKPAPKRRK
jgi:hypothetical protein